MNERDTSSMSASRVISLCASNLLLLLVLALVAAACSSDSSDDKAKPPAGTSLPAPPSAKRFYEPPDPLPEGKPGELIWVVAVEAPEGAKA